MDAMIFALYWRPNFISTYRGDNVYLAKCLNSVLNVKALVVQPYRLIVNSSSPHLVSAERQQLPGRHKVRIGLQQLGPAIVADEGLAGDTRPPHHLVSVAHQVGPRPTRQP